MVNWLLCSSRKSLVVGVAENPISAQICSNKFFRHFLTKCEPIPKTQISLILANSLDAQTLTNHKHSFLNVIDFFLHQLSQCSKICKTLKATFLIKWSFSWKKIKKLFTFKNAFTKDLDSSITRLELIYFKGGFKSTKALKIFHMVKIREKNNWLGFTCGVEKSARAYFFYVALPARFS